MPRDGFAQYEPSVQRPDADPRPATPSISPRRVRRPLQSAPASSVPPAAPTRSGQPGKRATELASSAAEGARWCDQRVLPGSVTDVVNLQVRQRAMGFEAVQACRSGSYAANALS